MSIALSAIRESVRTGAKRAIELIATRLPRKVRSNRRLILAYHGIRDAGSGPVGERTLHIAADAFDRHLRLLKREADVVSLDDLLNASHEFGNLVAITFDDAYASAVENGVALCLAHDLPCTMFVAPGLLGKIPRWDTLAMEGRWTPADRLRWLNEQANTPTPPPCDSVQPELQGVRISTELELRRALTTHRTLHVANHTFNHVNLGIASRELQIAEVQSADSWLADFAGDRYVPHLAHPFGIPPRGEESASILSPGAFGLLSEGGSFGNEVHIDRCRVPRWNVPAEISDHGFLARIRGWLLQHRS